MNRAFSANVIEALTPMFAADVVMPQPGGKFAHDVDEAVTALKANPDNLAGTADWAPIRGGISADGTQGFTFGYMTLHRPDGVVSTDLMPASLPAALVAPAQGTLALMQASLAAAEKAFSDESQMIGLGRRS